MDRLTELAAEAGFELLAPAIHSGSASVFKARDLEGEGVVALKLNHPGHDSQRIRQEADALSRLQHPHIVRLVKTGTLTGTAYLATEWIDGVTLGHWAENSAWQHSTDPDIDQILALIAPLLDALDYAHENNVVHGDISPSNVMVTREGWVKLIDFGIGSAGCEATMTAHDELAGTPRYLAPELIRGESPAASSDQYASAVILYELLTGQWPFAPQSSSAAAALHHQLYTEPTPVSEYRPDLPISVDLVFAKALAKSPEGRYPNLRAMHDALAEHCTADTEGVNQSGTTIRRSVRNNEANRSQRQGYWPRIQPLSLMSGLAVLSCVMGLSVVFSTPLERPASSDSASLVEPQLLMASVAQREMEIPVSQYCNLYPNPEFNDALEQNFYQDSENPVMAARLEQSTEATSPLLQLGQRDVYGLYGVIIVIEPNQSYTFSAQLFVQDYVHKMELNVLWLDGDWQVMEGTESKLAIAERVGGRYTSSQLTAPAEARYAVPTLYKDASSGVAFADDIVFSVSDGACHSTKRG